MISLYNYACPLFELFSHYYINKKKFKMSSVINSGLKVKSSDVDIFTQNHLGLQIDYPKNNAALNKTL